MVIKFFGALLIMTASTLIGYIYSNIYNLRVKELRELQYGIQMLETEIVYGYSPLPEALDNVSRRVSLENISLLFSEVSKKLKNKNGLSVSEAWSITLNSLLSKTSLTEVEKDILIAFGKSLGISDVKNQDKNFKLTLTLLKQEELKAVELRDKNVKMYRNLGFLFGLALVIILI